MSDETFLESFIETLGTLPHEVRRNLDWLKNLDTSCSDLMEELRQAQQEYIQQAERKVLQLEPGVTSDGRDGVLVVVNDSNDGTSSDATTTPRPAIIPTTEELQAYIQDLPAYRRICKLQQDAMQQSDEKVAIAEQTQALVDATVRRLDEDLSKLESLLKVSGEFETEGGVKPNDLAAMQTNPASPDWILGKVISHDPATGMYMLADEDLESNKVFNLPEAQVIILSPLEKISRGDIVYAVYPDTTSFYQATIVQPPRKAGGGGGTFAMVHFVDDSDEHGITHDKAVLLKHIMQPPYGAAI